MNIQADLLIAEYRRAFSTANNTDAPEVIYSGGWFTIRNSRSGSYGGKYRRHAIERMRDVLLARAKDEARP